MSEKDKSGGESFDLDRLKQLIRLMEKHDLTEIKLQRDDQKWVLRRGGAASDAAFQTLRSRRLQPLPSTFRRNRRPQSRNW